MKNKRKDKDKEFVASIMSMQYLPVSEA